jgi:hypothetical protein
MAHCMLQHRWRFMQAPTHASPSFQATIVLATALKSLVKMDALISGHGHVSYVQLDGGFTLLLLFLLIVQFLFSFLLILFGRFAVLFFLFLLHFLLRRWFCKDRCYWLAGGRLARCSLPIRGLDIGFRGRGFRHLRNCRFRFFLFLDRGRGRFLFSLQYSSFRF